MLITVDAQDVYLELCADRMNENDPGGTNYHPGKNFRVVNHPKPSLKGATNLLNEDQLKRKGRSKY